jgi:hypothetical protein
MPTEQDTAIAALKADRFGQRLARILRYLATGLLAIAAACGSDSTGPGGNGPAELSGMLVIVADSFGHSAIEAIETDGTGRRELVARSQGRIGTVLIGPGGDRLVFMRVAPRPKPALGRDQPPGPGNR